MTNLKMIIVKLKPCIEVFAVFGKKNASFIRFIDMSLSLVAMKLLFSGM